MVLIVSVPGHCLYFLFTIILHITLSPESFYRVNTSTDHEKFQITIDIRYFPRDKKFKAVALVTNDYLSL